MALAVRVRCFNGEVYDLKCDAGDSVQSFQVSNWFFVSRRRGKGGFGTGFCYFGRGGGGWGGVGPSEEEKVFSVWDIPLCVWFWYPYQDHVSCGT